MRKGWGWGGDGVGDGLKVAGAYILLDDLVVKICKIDIISFVIDLNGEGRDDVDIDGVILLMVLLMVHTILI